MGSCHIIQDLSHDIFAWMSTDLWWFHHFPSITLHIKIVGSKEVLPEWEIRFKFTKNLKFWTIFFTFWIFKWPLKTLKGRRGCYIQTLQPWLLLYLAPLPLNVLQMSIQLTQLSNKLEHHFQLEASLQLHENPCTGINVFEMHHHQCLNLNQNQSLLI